MRLSPPSAGITATALYKNPSRVDGERMAGDSSPGRCHEVTEGLYLVKGIGLHHKSFIG